MSELVSTFLPVTLRGGGEYLFFIVTWADYVTPISEQLEKQAEAFGADLGIKGAVIRAYRQHAKSTFAEVLAKKWPEEVRQRFDSEQDPFMLITRKAFQAFDPREADWAIVWFSSFRETPDSIYRVFGSLARKIERGENVFKYAKALATKAKYKRFGKYFELKTPELFGVSLDVKAMLEDMTGAHDD